MCQCMVCFLLQTQNLALALFGHHEVPVSLFLQVNNSSSLVVRPIFHLPYQLPNEAIHHQQVQERVSKVLSNCRYTPPLLFPSPQCLLPYEKAMRLTLGYSRSSAQKQLQREENQPWLSQQSSLVLVSPRSLKRRMEALSFTVSKLDFSSGRQIFRRGDGLRNFIHYPQHSSVRLRVLFIQYLFISVSAPA